MPQEWGSYFCNVNGKLASIALDLSLAPNAPIGAKPWLLWVFVDLRIPRSDGLSSNAEFDLLAEIEDELAKRIGKACDAIQAGRITTDGHREFYFYGANDSGFKAAVTESMAQFEPYKFDLGSKQDPGWGQYRNVLYPADEDFQKMKNQDVLQALLDHGDQLTPIRDVHHWIYFHSDADRQRFAGEASELGYQIEDQTDRPGEFPFGLQIVRDQSVTPDQIDNAVVELFRLAKQVSADYDGWEARVIAVEN